MSYQTAAAKEVPREEFGFYFGWFIPVDWNSWTAGEAFEVSIPYARRLTGGADGEIKRVEMMFQPYIESDNGIEFFGPYTPIEPLKPMLSAALDSAEMGMQPFLTFGVHRPVFNGYPKAA